MSWACAWVSAQCGRSSARTRLSTPRARPARPSPWTRPLRSTTLYPGFCNDIDLTLTSHNDIRVKITNVANNGFSPSSLGGEFTQADVSGALNGQTLQPGETKTFTIPNAVCLSANAGNADQNVTFSSNYRVSANLSASTEAP